MLIDVKVGDWIEWDDGKNNAVGFILSKSPLSPFGEYRLSVKVTDSNNKKFIGKKLRLDMVEANYDEFIINNYTETEQDIDNMIDIALITNNREWFNELANKKKNYLIK